MIFYETFGRFENFSLVKAAEKTFWLKKCFFQIDPTIHTMYHSSTTFILFQENVDMLQWTAATVISFKRIDIILYERWQQCFSRVKFWINKKLSILVDEIINHGFDSTIRRLSSRIFSS